MTKELTKAQKIRSIIAASSGNLVEWFDFYIYAFTAVYFAHNFSNSDNPTIQQISAFGVFAAGFFMRPIGSWLFGSLADKIGRKSSMVFSVILMAVGSFLIAALPSKESVGDLAIILLLIARLIQGFERRRRVWHSRYLPFRACHKRTARLLLIVSICNAHRRTAFSGGEH